MAAHGERGSIIDEAARGFGVGRQTIARWLKDGHRPTQRRRRSDAGQRAATYEECEAVARVMRGGFRANEKQIRTLADAVGICRANKLISAERVDEKTGEIFPLSVSAIARAMRDYGLAADALRAPKPHTHLSSPHPNHLWQVDASVCVLFYLPAGRDGAGNAIVPLHKAVHYKNKPKNLKAIENFRVVRYVATDHASGVIRARYYPHAESGEHTADFLCWLMADKGDPQDPFRGRPAHLMVDPGATAAGLVRQFCGRMGIHLTVCRPKNPRAKGLVEQANNLWEIKFEGWLNFAADRITDFAALNALADTWQVWFNRTHKHTRHGMTQLDAWKRIAREQLIETASAGDLRKLALSCPLTPKVQGDLTVRFEGGDWYAGKVPGIQIGQPLPVCCAPLAGGGAVAIIQDKDGGEALHPLEEVTKDAWGFPDRAAVAGVEFIGMPDTDAVKTAKRLDLLDTGAATQAEAEKIRAASPQREALADRLNPYLPAERMAASCVHDLPIAGTPMPLPISAVAPRTLTATRAAMRARGAGRTMEAGNVRLDHAQVPGRDRRGRAGAPDRAVAGRQRCSADRRRAMRTFFKNLQIYRLPKNLDICPDFLEKCLAELKFQPCASHEMASRGWVEPCDDYRLLCAVRNQWLVELGVESRLLPASAVRQEAAARAKTLAEKQGYKPGRRQIKELCEQAAQELMPRAFTRMQRIRAWIDPADGWLGIDTPSQQRAEEVLECLRQTVGGFPAKPLRTGRSPASAMADWLTGGGDVVGHVHGGKLPARLALTWSGRVSFVLTDRLELRRICFLDAAMDELGDGYDAYAAPVAEFVLMAGELSRLLPALLGALGGESS
ncbi:MAG: recombination-associated protein RdgC [Azoarcus sp.]|nr:recombination-associated protein RdgC [Azoarcus sp.]